MYNRSKKYTLLLLLNIVVLVTWYIQQEEVESSVFNTEYVIELIENNDKSTKTNEELTARLKIATQRYTQLETEMAITEANSLESTRNNGLCEQEKELLSTRLDIALERVNTAPTTVLASCSEEIQTLDSAQRQIASYQERMDELISENALLRKDLILTQQRMSEIDDQQEVEQLRARLRQLEQDIENPIYLQSLYISERQCDSPRFEDLACVQEFLLRPKFSKAPRGTVTVNIYAPSNKSVASGKFSSKRAQLYRLSLRGSSELLPIGEYRAEFMVDGELLESETYTLARR